MGMRIAVHKTQFKKSITPEQQPQKPTTSHTLPSRALGSSEGQAHPTRRHLDQQPHRTASGPNMTLHEVKKIMLHDKQTCAARNDDGSWSIIDTAAKALSERLPLVDPHITTAAELAQDDAEILPSLVNGQPVITPAQACNMSDGREI